MRADWLSMPVCTVDMVNVSKYPIRYSAVSQRQPSFSRSVTGFFESDPSHSHVRLPDSISPAKRPLVQYVSTSRSRFAHVYHVHRAHRHRQPISTHSSLVGLPLSTHFRTRRRTLDWSQSSAPRYPSEARTDLLAYQLRYSSPYRLGQTRRGS